MCSVTEAEGLAELGLWQDAWDVLEAIPAAERSAPAVLRVRLACCPPLGAWTLGTHVADLLRDGCEEDRQSAAEFYHAIARKWLSEGDHYAAKQAMKAAAEAWPKLRLMMLDGELSDLL
ncbi:hypothetical protein [Luteolibacter soli]|uniref:Uncharacterized protein n=1 Tax=Luteolibacter soli TaxID=3135280 RepID=A0ABU9ARQ4_9BACT